MPQTMAQKMIRKHQVNHIAGESVIALDRVFGHEVTTPAAIRKLQEHGSAIPFAREQVAMIVDHVTPAKDSFSAAQAGVLRTWSREHGVAFYDVGHNGVCHVVFAEKGWVKPGMTVVMGDSHTCTHGALAAFAFGVGTTDLAVAIRQGLAVMSAPPSIRVEFCGTRAKGVTGKDMALAVVAQIGHGGATNCVLEFAGSAIVDIDMEERMTLCNMAVETGATTGIFPYDEVTESYLQQIGVQTSDAERAAWKGMNADAGANYMCTLTFDLGELVPMATWGNRPDQVVPLAEMPYTEVQQVWIGSCTNGRMGDLRQAAEVLKGKRVAPQVRAIVTPASTAVWEEAMREGLFEVFSRAGFCITSPGCGACMGMGGGVLAPGEVCASTSNRNFSGRMGEGGQVHLMSPASAAQVAIMGYMGSKQGEKVCG